MDARPASTLAKFPLRNPVQIHPTRPAPAGETLADMPRKLWRQRRMIATLTVLASGLAATVAWSIPPCYSAEARVLVDVHPAGPKDVGFDAERVQNEGFVLQSRPLAKLVIDKLQLADNPAFNRELQPPSSWTLAFTLDRLLPERAREWLDRQRAEPAVPAAQQADRLLRARDNRLIDILLSNIEVSPLGRSHVLSVRAQAQEPTLAASIANTLAELYLDGQRRERIAALHKVGQGSGTHEFLLTNARLVSPAAPPETPADPPRPLLALLAAMGGLLLASAFALLRERADPTFRRADEVEAITGLSVLAMVPQVPTRMSPSMQVLRQPSSTYSEALRRLQIGIELSKAGSAPRTVLFSSAMASEGKSAMVSSLARLMASNGRRILVIDCDWHSPHQHQIFRCPLGEGLAELLADKAIMLEDILHHDALSGVDVLSAGRWSPRQVYLLTSPRMRQLLDALAPRYDLILLDTAPALATADVLALSRMVEKVVFVIRWAHTRQGTASEALTQIVESQGNVAGVVLSRVVPRATVRRPGFSDPLDRPLFR